MTRDRAVCPPWKIPRHPRAVPRCRSAPHRIGRHLTTAEILCQRRILAALPSHSHQSEVARTNGDAVVAGSSTASRRVSPAGQPLQARCVAMESGSRSMMLGRGSGRRIVRPGVRSVSCTLASPCRSLESLGDSRHTRHAAATQADTILDRHPRTCSARQAALLLKGDGYWYWIGDDVEYR